MFRLKTFLLITILVITLSLIKDRVGKTTVQLSRFSEEEKGLELQIEKGVGEKITYDVKLGHLRLGKAIFRHLASTELNGQRVNVMAFETSLARFKDIEVIYTDPQTLLPLRVERNVLNWLTQEKITEEYNQQDFTVTISKNKGKNKGGKTQGLVIKKDQPIHNAILLPQYIRRLVDPAVTEVLVANFPNRKYEIRLVGLEEIKVPAGRFKAYHFKSIPRQIDIWISADERRIPLKIQTTATFGYLLVLREYVPGSP